MARGREVRSRGAALLAAAAWALVACSGSSGAGGTGGAVPRSVDVVLPGAAVFPEGITIDSRDGTLYAGSTEDGTVFRVPPGEEEAEVFLPPGEGGRTAVTGLAVDPARDRLLVAGRDTGRLFVHDLGDGSRVAARSAPPGGQTLVNDIALLDGTAYVTDSFRPVLYRLLTDDAGRPGALEGWLDLRETDVPFLTGEFNLNGVTAAPDGRTLIAVHYETGELFAIDTTTKSVTRVDLEGGDLRGGDGLEVLRAGGRGLELLVVTEDGIRPVTLESDLVSGVVGEPIATPDLRYPTTFVVDGAEIVVVNSQLDMAGRRSGADLPFTLTRFPMP